MCSTAHLACSPTPYAAISAKKKGEHTESHELKTACTAMADENFEDDEKEQKFIKSCRLAMQTKSVDEVVGWIEQNYYGLPMITAEKSASVATRNGQKPPIATKFRATIIRTRY